MAIANELSSDVAAALLAHKENKGPSSEKELKELLLNFYSALRPLTTESRRRRVRTSPPLPSSGQAASGNN